MKKLLALVLSIAIVLTFLPVLPAMAEESEEFGYAQKLNAEIGKTVISHDYSAMTALPNEITGNATHSNDPNSEKSLCFGNYWNGDGRNAKISVGTENFAAKVTMVVDNVQTNKIGGTFAFRTLGKNANDAEAIASYIRFGLPDRTAGTPFPGGAIYNDELAEYGFSYVGNVTPFTADCKIETYTFYVYSFNGTTYYVKEDNTLMCAAARTSGVSEANVIEMFCEYGIVYVTDLVVAELNEIKPENPLEDEALAEKTGFSIGEKIVAYDFAEYDTAPEGWTLTSSSVGKGSGESVGRNVLRLNNNTGASNASFNIASGDVAILLTAGIDYSQTLAGSLVLAIKDTNGNFGASWSLGLPKRSAEHMLKAGKSCITDNVNYYYPESGNYEYNVGAYTTVQMLMFYSDGAIYCYWPDGAFVGSIKLNANADMSNGTTISLGNDWATAYIHDISVYNITPYVPPFNSGLVENSGFIAGDMLANIDFANATDEGWTFKAASIGAGSGESATRSVLRLSDEWGYSNATYTLPAKNFAATVTIGIDYAQKLSGSFVFGVNDADGVRAANWSLGLPKRSESQTLKAGKSCISDNKSWFYPAAGNYEYNEAGYTTLKMVMYLYDGIFYFFWEDGRFVYSIPASSACDLSKGDLQLVLANDYGRMYVHDLKIYEIIPNTLKVDFAKFGLDGETPVIDFNMSYDNALKDVVSAENLEFGAVVTINDNATTTDVTIDTEGAVIWELEKGQAQNDIFKFAKEMTVTEDILDKFVNVRLFVKNGEIYSYADAVSYCPAQLADVFYRSTQSEDEKKAVEEIFAESEVFFGKESKKTTFTVFSDFHYIEGMYISSIADMNTIMDRANESGSSFVLSAGDMCNDISGSPELINAFKNNKYGIDVANVYGNHELELANDMSNVTETLTNVTDAVWGTADGSFDANIAYFYFERDGFRIICTDTNYSWNPTSEIWEHNKRWSYGPPAGNQYANSLGPVQIEWLQNVLDDAAEKDIPCIVMSHAALNNGWGEQSSDASTTQKMFEDINKVNPGTVMMHISGHAHDDRIENINGIVYFRCNTTRNGYWKGAGTDHYTEEDTYMQETYDKEGNFLGYVEKKIGELSGGKNTHFTKEALSATVTIDECGIITIEGMGATWMNGVEPDLTGVSPYIRPQISNYSSFNCEAGHIWADNYTVEADCHYKKCINPDCTITEKEENAYYGEHEFINGECVCGKTEAAAYENGDINGDGSVNAADLALLKKVIAGLTPIDDEEVKNPDVDGEGGATPNAADLAMLKKKIAGLE